MIRTVAACPCCGQRLLVRHGVALSPGLADLFDIIWRVGQRGIEPEVLAGVFYPGKSRQAAHDCIKVNVFHLNTKLAETDFEVRAGSGRREPYRVMKRKRHDYTKTLSRAALVRRPQPRPAQRVRAEGAEQENPQSDDPRRPAGGGAGRIVRPSAVRADGGGPRADAASSGRQTTT
jgi:hypothetical protein